MIIPVFDMKDSMCVSGKSGDRKRYTQLESVYGEDIFEIVNSLKDEGFNLIYIADIDKIEDVGSNSQIIKEINNIIPVMLDNGIKTTDDVNPSICTYNIIATETLLSLNEAYRIFEDHENLILSVDIKDDKILSDANLDLEDIVELITKVNPLYVILLNISQVGSEGGNKSTLINEIISTVDGIHFIIGGGITNESIKSYNKCGVDDFLIGTILHNGMFRLSI